MSRCILDSSAGCNKTRYLGESSTCFRLTHSQTDSWPNSSCWYWKPLKIEKSHKSQQTRREEVISKDISLWRNQGACVSCYLTRRSLRGAPAACSPQPAQLGVELSFERAVVEILVVSCRWSNINTGFKKKTWSASKGGQIPRARPTATG